MRILSLIIFLVNTTVWLRTSYFSKGKHIAHWFIGSVSIILNFPLLRCDVKSQQVLIFDFMSNLVSLGVFQFMTAVTPLHGAGVIATVTTAQAVIFKVLYDETIIGSYI